MSFVTNLLTRSDSSFMIGEEVKDGSIIMRLLRPVHFAASYLFTELGSKWLIFISVGLPFLSVIILMKILSGQGIVEVLGLTVLYLFSLTLAYLINFFFNICFGFSAFVFKNLWGSNLLKTSIVAFMSGSLIPLAFFPKVVSAILSFLPFSSPKVNVTSQDRENLTYGMQGKVVSVIAKKTFFNYFKDKLLNNN